MTEREWERCADPGPMLEFLEGKASERKLRLFVAACCRRVWQLIPEDVGRRAVELAEGYADGAVVEKALLKRVRVRSNPVHHRRYNRKRGMGMTRAGYAQAAAWAAVGPASGFESAALVLGYLDGAVERKAQSALLRDVFGPLPFRPVAIDRAALRWNGGTILKLSQAVYHERAFDRLPVLADALEEAGCTDCELLGHLRGPGPHARGCFVIDALLGKE